MSVPSRAPIREIKVKKTVIPLAMTYARTETVKVQLSQVIQCRALFDVKCLDPLSSRTKMYLAGNYVGSAGQ
jgi:hypothetical protein